MTFEQIWENVGSMNDHYAIPREELQFIIDKALTIRDGRFLELGVCHGRTLAALAMAANAYGGLAYGIDHFGLEGSAAEVAQEFRDRHISWATILEANTHDYPWDSPVDVLVVDAGHDEANVKPDIEKYLPFVNPGGFVFFDDYGDPVTPPGAHWAIRHYADIACKDWEDLGIVGRMRGWQRP